MKRKCITIAISNQKGGVGKTSSTACIGAALALQGKRILLVDLDAQQNLTFTLTQNEDPETSIYDALVKDKPLPIVPIRKNLDLVPASLDLARAEIDMATMMAREGILKSHLDGQKEKYDYILMDCSPSLGIVTTNALVALFSQFRVVLTLSSLACASRERFTAPFFFRLVSRTFALIWSEGFSHKIIPDSIKLFLYCRRGK